MAQWKKLIVSGSDAELNQISLDTQITVGQNQQITTDPSTTFLSGSFSGSFFGINIGDISGLEQLSTGNGLEGGPYDGTSPQTFTLDTGSVHFRTGVDNLVSGGSTQGIFTVNGTNKTLTNLETTSSPTFAGLTITNDVTIGGDLIVNGDVTAIRTTNLEVEDRYILLNSGSGTSTAKGGIIIESGSAGNGKALVYNDTDTRWGFIANADSTSATIGQVEAFVPAVTTDSSPLSSGEYVKVGNINIDSNDDIWIYV